MEILFLKYLFTSKQQKTWAIITMAHVFFSLKPLKNATFLDKNGNRAPFLWKSSPSPDIQAHGGSLGEEYSEVLLVDASRRPATQLQRFSCAALQAVTTTGRVGRVEWVTMALRLHLAQLGGETKMLEWKLDQIVRLIFGHNM